MTGSPERPSHEQDAAAYTTPVLKRFGSASELTKARNMAGAMDGGANSTRTQ